jgi:hypothetical protein
VEGQGEGASFLKYIKNSVLNHFLTPQNATNLHNSLQKPPKTTQIMQKTQKIPRRTTFFTEKTAKTPKKAPKTPQKAA